MTIEKLYATIMGSDELKASLVAAAKEGKLAEFLKSQGCEATKAEVLEFIKSKQNAEERSPTTSWILSQAVAAALIPSALCASLAAAALIKNT